MHPELQFLLIYLLAGCFVGFFAGLLGIGGGAVMVPILSLTFVARGFSSEHVIHMALATSMATILPGAFASARTHHKLGAVNWLVVRQMVPGILLGTASGTIFAYFSNTAFLKSFFVAFICFLAFQMAFGVKLASRFQRDRGLPGWLGMAVFGTVMGFVSALAGIGGAVLSILFLTWCNVRLHDAIGTAAAIGLPLAFIGTIGFVVTGLADPALPKWSVGYVYLPAFFGIALTSFFVAPYGARLAHRLPVDTLKKIFMLFLIALAIKMAISV
ncbi:MAG: sulfite exporter TauE/SafE family protein [Rhodocyclaceae bacterium]|nr:sulfite exporter TauE/SafE family protein [Rhodocyclaceae bacterium]MCA3020116.1 sulfite exporter TauE/SafE family protein [Rhodocyclaceae bacterium]MCA3021747.1 sulfite exporter TauE/SafE family protein [Rhodocyclaceae bacterium]MCA3023967.1 sulfite exporter TauE/SafE family protein [Rhodocyclaceae bacterium]MCA3030753.1 sulfite exporter TauE/SafE family protein [Rhodocyclaceae bacterium]